MEKDVKKEKKLNLENTINPQQMLQAFTKEFQEYLDCYGELVIIDGVSRMRDDMARIVKSNEPDPIKTENISGLIKSYYSLLEFERKYPFIDRNLASKAAELPKLGDYLTGRKRGD